MNYNYPPKGMIPTSMMNNYKAERKIENGFKEQSQIYNSYSPNHSYNYPSQYSPNIQTV
jgi:hypothetical protein